MSEIIPGLYEHFKGGKYHVLGVAKHSETLEEYVVYIHLGKDSFGTDNSMWIRPASMFKESVEIEGRTVPRFKYLGDSSTNI
jgi:hypothetical protein